MNREGVWLLTGPVSSAAALVARLDQERICVHIFGRHNAARLEHARAGTEMEIWGDGENVRGYIYIDDVAEAGMRFFALPHDSGTYDLGSGREYCINQVLRFVEPVAGVGLKVVHSSVRGIDVRAEVSVISRIAARQSWKLQTSLEAGAIYTWNWSKQV